MTKKIAFVFPGQGSQTVGMLAELAEQHPIVAETFKEASTALGFDLWLLTQHGPAETLNQTANTQPALLAASIALWRIWQQKNLPSPILIAGHSLGEYSALVCAGTLDFATAIKLVAHRGHFMQEAVPENVGAMAAIVGLEDNKVAAICTEAAQGETLSPANYNAIGQVVIAGHSNAVDRAVALAQQAGAKMAKRIPVSVPSHCALMHPAAEKLATRFKAVQWNKPTIDVINNVDVTIEKDPHKISDALLRQLYNPVRWVETVQLMAQKGVESIIECGPGKVLAGLNKRIVAEIPTLSFEAAISQ